MAGRDDMTDEFLSGYLDVRLTKDERAAVERLLASKPELRESLRRLTAVRDLLAKEPTRVLDSGFANRVIKASRERAVEMGANAPTWIVQNEIDSDVVRQAGPSVVGHRKLAAGLVGLMALAASVLFFAYVGWRGTDPVGSDSLGNSSIARIETSRSANSNDQQSNAANESIAQPTVPAENLAVQTSEVNSRDTSTSFPVVTNASQPAHSMAPIPANTIASDPLQKSAAPMIAAADSVGPPAQTAPQTQEEMLRELEKQLSDGKMFRYLLVVDISLSQSAWDENRIRSIFSRYDIAYEDPVVVNDALRESLKTSRIVGPLSAEPDLASAVALVFVKARGERLDRAIADVMERIEDYPEMSLDLAIDPPAQDVMDRLKNIREFGDDFDLRLPSAERQGVARSLTVSPANDQLGLVNHFGAAKRHSPVMSNDARHQPSRTKGLDLNLNPVEYCLFVLRAPIK